ncbi:MAG: NADPH cytochrome P450 oxidoreductase family protein [Bacteroidota bacterium]
MYSGLLISYCRIASKVKNIYQSDEAEYVILVGTENGSTRNYAGILKKELARLGAKVFLDDMNNYRGYPKMQRLVVMTSTYGEGEPPSNANRFLELFENKPVQNPIQFSVVGFGSLSYLNFCQFAFDVNAAMKKNKNCFPILDPFFINNKSYADYKKWAARWGEQVGLNIYLPDPLKPKRKRVNKFTIIDKKSVNNGYDETFVLKVRPDSKENYKPGDLLAVYPPNKKPERLYSIGKDENGHILLSIKVHTHGVCSNYLNSLAIFSKFEAEFRKNKSFNFPTNADVVTMIANGTGIVPFIGMLGEAQKGQKINLYWGGRTYSSLSLYSDILDSVKVKGQFGYSFAFSKEKEKKYVQDILKADEKRIAEHLNRGGVFMICGSVTMQKGVLKIMEHISEKYYRKSLAYYINKGQLLMDCY